MKKLIMLSLMIISLSGFSQSKSNMPYAATYSSNFSMNNSKYVGEVLSAWKTFEENKLDEKSPLLADTVYMEMADGTQIKGKENVFNTIKQLRGAVKDLKVSMRAWMGIKSPDKNQDIVLLWVDETYTDKGGNKVLTNLHQVWVFNKDGKVIFLKDYDGKQKS